MKHFPRFALVASTLALCGANDTFATARAIPGFSFGESIDTHDVVVPSQNGREPMDPENLATRLHPSLRADSLRIESTFRAGNTTRQIFPSNWWPMKDEGIASRWNANTKNYADWTSDRDNLGPTEKYDLLFYPGQNKKFQEFRAYTLADSKLPVADRGEGILRPAITVVGPATAWEMANHGTYQDIYPEEWWGHCNGWSSYVTGEPDGAPLRDIRVRLQNNKIVECNDNDAGCVFFRMADIEALMSEIYFQDVATVAGRRCNTPRDKIERDAQGRPIDPACRDLNPATLHLAVTGLLGRGAAPLSNLNGATEKLPFIMDYAYHEEIWAFPVVGYEVRKAQYVTEEYAARLVCRTEQGPGRCRSYKWNQNATRFASIELAVYLVAYETTAGGLLEAPMARQFQPTQIIYSYVLELDSRGTILGGEWIDPPGGTNSKDMHPDFIFMSVQPEATSEDADDRNGSVDNPYLSSINVKELLRISRTPAP